MITTDCRIPSEHGDQFPIRFSASGVCHVHGSRQIPERPYDGVPLAYRLPILPRLLSHHRHQNLSWIRDLEEAAEYVPLGALN